jgi:hypothetical protein
MVNHPYMWPLHARMLIWLDCSKRFWCAYTPGQHASFWIQMTSHQLVPRRSNESVKRTHYRSLGCVKVVKKVVVRDCGNWWSADTNHNFHRCIGHSNAGLVACIIQLNFLSRRVSDSVTVWVWQTWDLTVTQPYIIWYSHHYDSDWVSI